LLPDAPKRRAASWSLNPASILLGDKGDVRFWHKADMGCCTAEYVLADSTKVVIQMDIPVTSALRGALGALAALAFTSTVWLAATPAAADDYDTCGKASGNEAIAACTRAIDSGQYSGRQLAALFNNRCSEWNGKQESDKAFADCDEAIRLYPNYALAFFNRGNAYYAKGQYDRAIEVPIDPA